VWLGFLVVLVVPSPKCHCQEVGVPVEVSVNCTAWPAPGEDGLYVNEAEEAEGITVIVRRLVLEPALLPAVRLTL
jgi:hypothetical protein